MIMRDYEVPSLVTDSKLLILVSCYLIVNRRGPGDLGLSFHKSGKTLWKPMCKEVGFWILLQADCLRGQCTKSLLSKKQKKRKKKIFFFFLFSDLVGVLKLECTSTY